MSAKALSARSLSPAGRRARLKGLFMFATEAEGRAAVVAEARSWIGTPYRHAGDIKGACVDCGMLLVRVFVDLGLVEPFDPRPYSRDWAQHRSEEMYLTTLLARAKPIAVPRPGDVAVFRYGRCHSHGGIVTNPAPLTIVHAFASAGRVIEEDVTRVADVAERIPGARFASYWA